MSLYTLINQATAVQTRPPLVVRPVPPDQQSNMQLVSGNITDPSLQITPPRSQVFQLNVVGTGTVAATAQIQGSNDGVNWLNYMTISAGSGTSPQTAGASAQVPYAFFGALITAISGTAAKATVTMSC